jgi:transposase-like protein
MERSMADAIVPVLCPNCGKENAVAIGDGEQRLTIDHLCVGCAEKFSVKVDEMQKQAADVAKATVKNTVQGIPGTQIK